MKLRQVGSVDQYQDAFDALLIRIEDFPANHASSCFLSGLTLEIQHTVRMFKPKTLHDAHCLAKLQEATLVSIARKKPILEKPPLVSPWTHQPRQQFPVTSGHINNPMPRSTAKFTPSPSYQSHSSSQGSSNTRLKKPVRPLTARAVDDRRARSLCFYCDEKYTPGHKCTAQVYKLELSPQEVEEKEIEGEMDDISSEPLEESAVAYEEVPHISMNAISGMNTYQSMKVMGLFKRHPLHIIIDSGSTHNFLDLSTTKRLGCDVRNTVPLQISFANRNKLISSSMCQDFQWIMNKVEFKTDVMVVPLGSCEMILGVQWLSTLGPILWDFDKLEMRFKYRDNTVVIHGNQQASVHWMEGRTMLRELSISAVPHIFAI